MYAHCKHCCWGSEHHPDDAAGHETACGSWCAESTLIQPDLFGGAA